MCTSVCGILSEVFSTSQNYTCISKQAFLYTNCVAFAASNCHFESLFWVRCFLCTSFCVGVTLTNTKANPGFVLYDQLNKATSLPHQSQMNKTQILFLPIFAKNAAFPMNQSKPILAKNAPIKKK